jgi:hypothetical protein
VRLVKKKLKMRVGKNFKNIQVGLGVGSLFSVSLLKNAFQSVRLKCQVAKSPFFSRHFQGCTVFLRLGITFGAFAPAGTKHFISPPPHNCTRKVLKVSEPAKQITFL